MFTRIRKIKRLEEFLGFIGLVYLLILIALSVILIRLLVNAGTSSLRASEFSRAPLSQYNLSEAEEIVRALASSTEKL